jgi:hypothetical protein
LSAANSESPASKVATIAINAKVGKCILINDILRIQVLCLAVERMDVPNEINPRKETLQKSARASACPRPDFRKANVQYSTLRNIERLSQESLANFPIAIMIF